MELEKLATHHVNQLLDFELINKLWFDSLIEPRADDFYSIHGVTAHVDTLIQQMNAGTAFSSVLIKNNAIVARANLKNMSSNSAYIGYRVGKNFTGQGIASYCLSQLIEKAQNEFGLKRLKAQVLDNNPASKRVLEKFGFQPTETLPNFLTLNDQEYSCTEFELNCFNNTQKE